MYPLNWLVVTYYPSSVLKDIGLNCELQFTRDLILLKLTEIIFESPIFLKIIRYLLGFYFT